MSTPPPETVLELRVVAVFQVPMYYRHLAMDAIVPTATPATGHAKDDGGFVVSGSSSIAKLVDRLSAEVDAAKGRVDSLQFEAARMFVEQKQLLMRFVVVADRIHSILLPRLQAFMNVTAFKDFKQTVSLPSPAPEGREFHHRTTTLIVPCSDKRPTSMKFSFGVGHDEAMKNAIIDYRLEILPIFIQFDGLEQIVVPMEELSEEAISAWIDDRLVGFTKTYFEVYFNSEYQRKTLETDPVLKIRFPRAMAVGQEERQGHMYYFYTEESRQLFERDPSAYAETA